MRKIDKYIIHLDRPLQRIYFPKGAKALLPVHQSTEGSRTWGTLHVIVNPHELEKIPHEVLIIKSGDTFPEDPTAFGYMNFGTVVSGRETHHIFCRAVQAPLRPTHK